MNMKKVFIAALTVLFVGLCLTSCEQKQSGSGDPVEGIQKAMLLGRWNVIAAYRTEDGIKVENHTPQGEYWIFYNDNMLQHGPIGDNTCPYAIDGNTIILAGEDHMVVTELTETHLTIYEGEDQNGVFIADWVRFEKVK
jgi:hypothetical protein